VVAVAIQENVETWGKGIAHKGRVRLMWWVAALMGAMLSACATFPSGGVTAESPPEVKQKAVVERAKARWQAVLASNVQAAYDFLSSGSKAAGSLAIYGGRARLKGFKSVDVISAVCEAEMCKVRVNVVLEHRLMKSIPMDIEEAWVLENGQYWYVWRP
jgi:hypothetical protein